MRHKLHYSYECEFLCFTFRNKNSLFFVFNSNIGIKNFKSEVNSRKRTPCITIRPT